jgi:hypothetical protein
MQCYSMDKLKVQLALLSLLHENKALDQGQSC